MAADRGERDARAPGPSLSVSRRSWLFALWRAGDRFVSQVHLRLADRLEPAAWLDASRQVGHDHARGEFLLARPACRRDRAGRRAAEEEGAGLAAGVSR